MAVMWGVAGRRGAWLGGWEAERGLETGRGWAWL